MVNLCNCKLSQLDQYFHLTLDLLWILLRENYLVMVCYMSMCLNCTKFPHLNPLAHFGLRPVKRYIIRDMKASRREALAILKPVCNVLLTHAVGMKQYLALNMIYLPHPPILLQFLRLLNQTGVFNLVTKGLTSAGQHYHQGPKP